MLVLVVLGNRLNDDGSISEIMLARLNLALQINEKLNPQKIVVSGGVANPNAGTSEAAEMQRFLTASGVDAQKIVLEDKSLTTKQNAKFSVPIVANLGATELLLCTSTEHMHRSFLNPVRLFTAQLKKTKIKLLSCCNQAELDNLLQRR